MATKSTEIKVTVYPRVYYTLSISSDKSSGYVGDSFTFGGNFRYNGNPVSGATVRLLRDGVEVGRTTTDSAGNWSIRWTADFEGMYTFVAEGTIPPGYPPPAT